jgi:hypothetical protein
MNNILNKSDKIINTNLIINSPFKSLTKINEIIINEESINLANQVGKTTDEKEKEELEAKMLEIATLNQTIFESLCFKTHKEPFIEKADLMLKLNEEFYENKNPINFISKEVFLKNSEYSIKIPTLINVENFSYYFLLVYHFAGSAILYRRNKCIT